MSAVVMQRFDRTEWRFLSWTFASALLALDFFLGLGEMNPDGISYLDMGEAIFAGVAPLDALSYWSPLYAIYLAGARAFLPFVSDFTAAHVANLILGFGAVALSNLLAIELRRHAVEVPPALAMAVTVWTITVHVRIRTVTPDLMNLLFVLAAVLLVLRSTRSEGWRSSALAGTMLGVAYYARASMFPLSVVLIALAAVVFRRRFMAFPAVAAFAAVVAPLVIVLSLYYGSFTFSRSAPLNYAWYVNGVTRWVHWQGDEEMEAAHPTRMLRSDPAAYEFATPFKSATYPPWFAPPYWYQGLETRFDGSELFAAWNNNLEVWLGIARESLPQFAALFLMIALLIRRRKQRPESNGVRRFIALFVLAAIGMYALVHTEPRFIAAFLLLGILSACDLPAGTARRATFILSVVFWAGAISTLVYAALWETRRGDVHLAVAKALRTRGFSAGAPVAVIGSGFEAYWAKLAGVRLIAECPRQEIGQLARSGNELVLVEAFRSAGAIAVVIEPHPTLQVPNSRPLGTTGYSLVDLRTVQ